MYRSRLFITNGIVSIELDALSGELLAFVREDTQDNALKNFIRPVTGILDGVVYNGDSKRHLNIPRYAQIRTDSSMTPEIHIEQKAGEAYATIRYPHLVADGEKTDIAAVVQIHLPHNDCRTRWILHLDNPTENEVQSINFPQLNGLWLGDSWEDDYLVIPKQSGEKIKNPTNALSAKPVQITWKWQEYLHTYNMSTTCGAQDDRGIYSLTRNYTGGCSMLWMDLYNEKENTGIYLTCRDPEMLLKGINVSTLGNECPGIGMGIVHYPCLTKGEWQSGECIAAFHSGDWHWAADEYRAYRNAVDRPKLSVDAVPQWFKESVGLVAHYDFQYQGGGIVHKFKDIPALYDKACADGFNHLFIAGWHINGFDNGFPLFRPNPLLGTEEELKASLSYVRRKGGHITFYVNSRLCNTGYEENRKRIAHSTAMNRDSSLRIEKYGAADLEFATLCMNDSDWRKALVDDVCYMIHQMGADSVYLDQMCLSASVLCYHPKHTEHAGDPAAWNQGYEKLMDELRAGAPETAVLCEGCCDIYGKGLSAQLITTLKRPAESCCPEVYKYTFPEQILTDMLNPRHHSGMRPEFVARQSTFIMYRAFVIGCYFWCYDLEEDNTFWRDQDQQARLRRTVALRKAWLQRYGQGIFRDQVGLVNVDKNALIKRFELDNGVLVACADEKGLCGSVTVEWNGDENIRASVLTDADPTPRPCDITIEKRDGKFLVTAALPDSELALVILKKA